MDTAKKEVTPKGYSKKTNKVKTPKVKLVTYTVKAIIPTGAYANIQPEIVVQAETLEQAERAVMPHIEALFAKYREGVPYTPVTITPIPTGPMTPKVYVGDDTSTTTTSSTTAVAPEIIFTVPFIRAKSAIDNCASIEALGLIENQIKISPKLVESEKPELLKLVAVKLQELNGKN